MLNEAWQQHQTPRAKDAPTVVSTLQTEIVDIRINFHRDMIELKLEHESFPEVEPGSEIPTRAFNMIDTGQYGGYRVPEQFRKGLNELFVMSGRACPDFTGTSAPDSIISRAE